MGIIDYNNDPNRWNVSRCPGHVDTLGLLDILQREGIEMAA